MSEAFATRTGMATAVAQSLGIPFLNSSLGRTRGGTIWVTSQLPNVMLRIDAGRCVREMPSSQAQNEAHAAAREGAAHSGSSVRYGKSGDGGVEIVCLTTGTYK